jgi:hypothetical protein
MYFVASKDNKEDRVEDGVYGMQIQEAAGHQAV